MPIVASSTFASAPSLLTLAQAKAEIARFVKMPDATEGLQVAGEKWRNAIRKINTRTWEWSIARYDITLVADQYDYALPLDFKSARHCHVIDSSSGMSCRLGYLDPKSLDTEFQNITGSGDPKRYTVYDFQNNGLMSLDRAPSSTYVASYPTLLLRYYRRVLFPAEGDTLVFVPSEVELFLLWWAKWEMAMDYSPGKAAVARGEAEQLWRQLIVDDNQAHQRDWDN